MSCCVHLLNLQFTLKGAEGFTEQLLLENVNWYQMNTDVSIHASTSV